MRGISAISVPYLISMQERVKQAPEWMISLGMEWFYRLIKEPRRMWRRYLIGNTLFVKSILLEKLAAFNQFRVVLRDVLY